MAFRIDYGNGQVSETYKSRREAISHWTNLLDYKESAKMTAQDPETGDWYIHSNPEAMRAWILKSQKAGF